MVCLPNNQEQLCPHGIYEDRHLLYLHSDPQESTISTLNTNVSSRIEIDNFNNINNIPTH